MTEKPIHLSMKQGQMTRRGFILGAVATPLAMSVSGCGPWVLVAAYSVVMYLSRKAIKKVLIRISKKPGEFAVESVISGGFFESLKFFAGKLLTVKLGAWLVELDRSEAGAVTFKNDTNKYLASVSFTSEIYQSSFLGLGEKVVQKKKQLTTVLSSSPGQEHPLNGIGLIKAIAEPGTYYIRFRGFDGSGKQIFKSRPGEFHVLSRETIQKCL